MTVKRIIIFSLLLLALIVLLYLVTREAVRNDVSIFSIQNSSVGLLSSYSCVIEEWGEALSREIVPFGESGTTERLLLHYDGVTFSFVGPPRSDWQSVWHFYITSSEQRLVGREKLSVGSSRDEIERALLRRNIPSSVSESDDGYTILTTSWRVDRIMFFTLDENNIVTEIRVSLFP